MHVCVCVHICMHNNVSKGHQRTRSCVQLQWDGRTVRHAREESKRGAGCACKDPFHVRVFVLRSESDEVACNAVAGLASLTSLWRVAQLKPHHLGLWGAQAHKTTGKDLCAS